MNLRSAWMLAVVVACAGCSLPHAAARGDVVAADGVSSEAGPCGADFVRCGTQCVSPSTDPTNCGSCGNACALANAASRCESGACAVGQCNEGFGDCDGTAQNGCETRLDADPNCGACARRCEGAAPTCDALTRTCVSGCSPSQTRCGGACVDTQSNVNHCGACGTECVLANATGACVAGACAISACNDGYADCDRNPSNGCEVTLGIGANCTRCGEQCSGSTPICSGRALGCTSGCSAPALRCGTDCVDISSNGLHCGACNNACAPPRTASSRCELGVCRVVTCAAGFGDCDGNPLNGCETDVRSSTTHCGACGAACMTPNAAARCVGGVCTFSSCAMGYGDCDRIAANGCEVETRTSLAHCGGCANLCAPSNATASCTGGNCAFVACSLGFASCDGVARNGCEVDTRTSLVHCGACNSNCSRAHGTAACVSSACVLQSCDSGWDNCNLLASDGCEADLLTSAVHCGRCNNGCLSRPNSMPTCGAGVCSFRCNPNTGDCDGLDTNGCESTLNDLSNCGACGQPCALANATTSCATRTCTITACSPGFGNCNSMAADGCETPLGTDTNCASCRDACPMGMTCNSGRCS